VSYGNPYDKLINLFFQNVKDVGQGIQNRGQEQAAQDVRDTQRQQYLQDQERARQQQLADQEKQHQWALDQAQVQRSNALTDAATTYRQKQVSTLQDALAYMDPSLPISQKLTSIVHVLGQPLGATGQAALDQAMSGMVMLPSDHPSPSGQVVAEPVDVNKYIATALKGKESALQDEQLAQNSLGWLSSYLTNPKYTAQEKTDYVNQKILNSPWMPDRYKQIALSMAGITNPDDVARALQAKTLGDLQIQQASLGLQTAAVTLARQKLGLSQDVKLNTVTLEKAQVDLDNAIQQGKITAAQAYEQFGLYQADPQKQKALAEQLGYTNPDGTVDLEKFRTDGAAVWKRTQEKDAVGLELQNQAVKLNDQNINLNRIHTLTAQYQNEYARGQLLTQKADLGNVAFAAAANGDKNTLKMLEGMAESDPTAAPYLAHIDFKFLNDKADQVLGDEASKRQWEKDSRAAQLQQIHTQNYGNVESIVQSVGQRFMYSDNTPVAGGGPTQMQTDIQSFVNGITPAELQTFYPQLTTTDANGAIHVDAARTRLTEELTNEALFQKGTKAMSAAQSSLSLMANSAPGTVPEGSQPTAEQQNWLDGFIHTATVAGIPDAQALGEGILSAQNHQYWMDKLRADQINASIAASNAQNAVARKRLEQLKNGDPVTFNHQQYVDTLNGLEAKSANFSRLLSSSYCTVQVTAGTLGGVTGSATSRLDPNHPECQGYADGLAQATQQIDRLTKARSEGKNYVVPAAAKQPDSGQQVVYTTTDGRKITKSQAAGMAAQAISTIPYLSSLNQKLQDATNKNDTAGAQKLAIQLNGELKTYMDDPATYRPPGWKPQGYAENVGKLGQALGQNQAWTQLLNRAASLPPAQRASFFDENAKEIMRQFEPLALQVLAPNTESLPLGITEANLREIFNRQVQNVTGAAPINNPVIGAPAQRAP